MLSGSITRGINDSWDKARCILGLWMPQESQSPRVRVFWGLCCIISHTQVIPIPGNGCDMAPRSDGYKDLEAHESKK